MDYTHAAACWDLARKKVKNSARTMIRCRTSWRCTTMRRATIPGITSESMYYRMKRGDKLIPPSIRQQILDSAHRLGVPEAVDFDGYCEVIEV